MLFYPNKSWTGESQAKRTPNSNKAHTQGVYMTQKKKGKIEKLS